ncbi:sulfur carrier protein ThiS [Vibrio tapetis subsp. quintayensis]|uniref:sulfur carrier protein ThiS n=1 Tax=Vibrio tapetis TaxID=52443 RepID=UPI0025B5D72B|nr:sulfur carrier protein ThiS [Vibrio tapetis]MDN3679641.1 sulfur carrier protein ThiS [Vibrio tapetis subsp. quintayensis]
MNIEIAVNGKSVTLTSILSVAQMLDKLELSSSGCALAINGEIVPRSQWPEVSVNQGDEISLFQAIAGG